jgi:hypothetical protein
MKSDWLVRTYDSFENQIYQWVIRNRLEHEAESEAMNSVEVRESHDWSMTKVTTHQDIPTSFTIKFSGTLQVNPKFLDTSRVGDKMVINDLGELIQNAEGVQCTSEVVYDGLTLYEAEYNI